MPGDTDPFSVLTRSDQQVDVFGFDVILLYIHCIQPVFNPLRSLKYLVPMGCRGCLVQKTG